MSRKQKVGKLEIGVDLPNDTNPWFSVYMKSQKEKLRFPLHEVDEAKAMAVAAVLADMIRENVEAQ